MLSLTVLTLYVLIVLDGGQNFMWPTALRLSWSLIKRQLLVTIHLQAFMLPSILHQSVAIASLRSADIAMLQSSYSEYSEMPQELHRGHTLMVVNCVGLADVPHRTHRC